VFDAPGAHRDLHSFPTRRSSDLHLGEGLGNLKGAGHAKPAHTVRADARRVSAEEMHAAAVGPVGASDGIEKGRLAGAVGADDARSEEHTSELQSRENLVCRLLLE